MTDHAEASRDDEIERTTRADSSSRQLFDLRWVIGGLFTLYGVLVLGAGIIDGSDASDKAAGIDINIWTGIGMLALGLLMLLWMWLSPNTVVEPEDRDSDRATGG